MTNVLVLFCDQLRLDLLGCYGGRRVRTPHLDALAAEAAVFDRAYTPCALCSPARASLMTGLYPHRHHLFNNSTPGYSYCERLRSDLAILPDWVDAETTHESAYFGKWHIGPAADLFASRFHHTHPRGPDPDLPFLGSTHWHPDTGLGPLVVPLAGGRAGALRMPMERFPDVAAANFTRAFLRERKPGGRPFCAFCAFPGPHSPWLVPEAFGIRYDPAHIAPWPNERDRLDGKPLNQRKLLALRRRARPGGAAEQRELMAALFSYVELVDEQVGAVIEELKRTGQYDRTMVVFTADHGDMAGAHGFASKGAYMYEEIYRIPLLVKPPGAPAPRRIAAPVHLMDVTATLLHALRGAPVERLATHELQGHSLLPLIAGEAEWDRRFHYAEYHGDWYGHYSARMVTDGRWKLVWNLSDLGELYDLRNDPGELRNLFYEPRCRAVRDAWLDVLRREARRLDDAQTALLDPAVDGDPAFAALAGRGRPGRRRWSPGPGPAIRRRP